MAISKTVVGVVGAAALAVGGIVSVVNATGGARSAPQVVVDAALAAKRAKVPKDAKHLWAKQPDGGTLLRDPLPTLDDGGCQAWAQRCADKICRGSCE